MEIHEVIKLIESEINYYKKWREEEVEREKEKFIEGGISALNWLIHEIDLELYFRNNKKAG